MKHPDGDNPFDADNDDDFLYNEEPELDELEEAIQNCGQIHGGGCMKIGSEECDECPFQNELFDEEE